MVYSDKFGRYADGGVVVNSDMSDGMSAAVYQSVSVLVGVIVLGDVSGVISVVGVATVVVGVLLYSFISCFLMTERKVQLFIKAHWMKRLIPPG